MNVSSSVSVSSNLPAQKIDVLKDFAKINKKWFFRPDFEIARQIQKIQPLELSEELPIFFQKMIEEGTSFDPLVFVKRLAEVIPLEHIQKIREEDFFNEIQGLLQEAEFYLQTVQEKSTSTLKAKTIEALETMRSLIESLISAIGIKEMLNPVESDLHESFKSQKIMVLLTLFTAIGASAGGALVGEVLLAIALISLIWPFIKPITSYLPPNAECWTAQVRKEVFFPQGRKESLDEMASILKMNRHPMLVGPSRVGKSLTAKAFAYAVERGDYPELKGKVVFRLNMADLIDGQASLLGGGNKILNEISTAMGRHRNEIILVLDEIHMACKNNQKMADQLKIFLDEGGDFPHVIGITTAEEYQKNVKENQAFALRFDLVEIKNTSPDETLMILGQTLLRSHSKPLLGDKDLLQYIYDKSNEEAAQVPQPAASLKLLKKCVNRTEKTQRSPLEKKIGELQSKIFSLRAGSVLQFSNNKKIQEQAEELEKQLSALEVVLAEEKAAVERLMQAKDLLHQVTKKMYTSVVKISKMARKELSLDDKKHITECVLLREFLGKSLESYIRKKAKDLNVRVILDRSVVDDLIACN